jgi:LPS-assembly lipoprotein
MNPIPNWLSPLTLISENNDKQFTAILLSRLEGSSIHISADPAQGAYWLIIHEVRLQQQIISVGASTNPRQYTLTLFVNFMLKTRNGELLKAGTINVSRQLILNNDRILGSKDEERIMVDEMKQDAVTQIMSQLSRIRPSLSS